MNRTLTLKLITIAALIVLLLIPITLIRGLVAERTLQRDLVLKDIARSSSGPQQITGPLLVVPFVRTVHTWHIDPKTSERSETRHEERGALHFLPDRFDLDSQLATESRSRGIYNARLFHSRARLSGHFSLPPQLGVDGNPQDYQFESPFLALGISDIRGIENVPELHLNNRTLEFEPGALSPALAQGMHAPLTGIDPLATTRLDFSFELALQGTSQIEFSPVGRDSSVTLRADWPHPSFIGEFLPAERQVDDSGFTARWATTFFATNLEELLRDCLERAECEDFATRRFGVSLIDPVDQYLKSERAIKYALLFIGLTFAGFFLFEVLGRFPVHPVQYGLVGVALALFYLLLLSLSEHIGFAAAYLLSTTACVALLALYVGSVLHKTRHGLAFGGALLVLYGLLYRLLGAEDYALLLGSILVFGCLSAVMILTRKLNWYTMSFGNHAN